MTQCARIVCERRGGGARFSTLPTPIASCREKSGRDQAPPPTTKRDSWALWFDIKLKDHRTIRGVYEQMGLRTSFVASTLQA